MGVNQERINQYLKHTEFLAQLQVDNIYNAELRRVEKRKNLTAKCKEYQEQFEKEDNRNRGKIYEYYADMDSNDTIINMYFIAQDQQFVDCELRESVSSYIWLSDTLLVYSRARKGIYYYDLRNQTKGTIIAGEEDYKIESYKDGVLKYDGTEILIQF